VWCPWHCHRKPTESSEWFPLGYHQASGKIWCNTTAQVVLSFSQKITMWRTLHIHPHSHTSCMRLTLSADEKKSTYAHEGTLHLPTRVHLPCFISFHRKKIRQYFLNSPTYSVVMLLMMDSGPVWNMWSTLSNKFEKLCTLLAFIIRIIMAMSIMPTLCPHFAEHRISQAQKHLYSPDMVGTLKNFCSIHSEGK